MSMAELPRTQKERHRTTNKVNNYHKNLELQKAGTTQEVTEATQEGASASPTQDPHVHSATTTGMDPFKRSGNKGARCKTRPVTSVGGRATSGRHANQEPGKTLQATRTQTNWISTLARYKYYPTTSP